ncbi:MAG: CDP-glucose 4,6-dehydratase [Oscillospiraceae bacterium]|nr:CDP-glucose 4,6-dehydratase [Oscillospiraceae bacterium]
MDMTFFKGKRVFITGHTGFKGSWLCRILANAGADVTGYALDPPTDPSLFCLAGLSRDIRDIRGDVRDMDALFRAFEEARPEIVLHLAAQPIVRTSYREPHATFETNVMGTVNILECVRMTDTVRSFVNVTTDKVYLNREWVYGYRECDPLDGFDPYSNSKSCSELVTHSYKSSFFGDRDVAISTARAGNVIGGGDFAADRIIPDCVRAVQRGEPIKVRNPYSTRPYQHVLEPLCAYLAIARAGYEDISLADWYNVGPDDSSCVTTGQLVDLFVKAWGEGAVREDMQADEKAVHEAGFLKLDSSLIRSRLGVKPVWDIAAAVERVVEWEKCRIGGGDIVGCMDRQIAQYDALRCGMQTAD